VNIHKQRTQFFRYAIAVSLWVAFIFGTSCTVIRPLEFFELIRSFTGASRDSMERFTLFWGIAWFGVVKGWHFTEFSILTFLCAAAIKWLRGSLNTRSIAFVMILCTLFAVSDEWHQTFVPDRYGSLQDVLIDSLGVFTAGSYLLLQNRRKKIDDQSTFRTGSIR